MQQRSSSSAAFAQSVGAKCAVVALNAATGIITARSLRPEGRGVLAVLILWPVFLGSVTTFGVPSALTYRLRSQPNRKSEIVGTGLILAVLTSCLAIAVGWFGLGSWLAEYPESTIFWARVFLFATPLTSLILVGKAVVESSGDFKTSNILLLSTPAITLTGLVILFLAHRLSPLTAAAAYVPAGLIPLAWMLWRLWRQFFPSTKKFREMSQLLLSYGIRSYGVDLCGTMALYVDQALVVRFLDPRMMGIYVVALSLSRMLNVFHTSAIMVLFPKAVSRSAVEIREMTSRAARLSTLLTATAGLAIAFLGPETLSLLYGHEYRAAAPVLRLLVAEVVLAGATLVLSQAFMAAGRPGVVTILQLTGLLLTIPLMLVLVPRMGILGAAVALLLSTTTRFVLAIISFPLVLGVPVPLVFPKRSDINYLISEILLKISSVKNISPDPRSAES